MAKKDTVYNIKHILRIGTPLLAGNLSFYLLQITDTLMVGRLGTPSLGAIAFAGLFTGIILTFIWPVSVGVQAVSSVRFGRYKKNPAEENRLAVGSTLDTGIVVGAAMGLISFSVSFSAPFWFMLLVKDKTLIPLSLSYIRVVRWILLSGGVMMAFSGYLSGIRKTGYVMAANAGGSLLNVVLNYIFIFGRFGVSPMGISGSALGTVLAGLAQVVFLFVCITGIRGLRKFDPLKFMSLNYALGRSIFKVFIPIAVQNAFALGIFMVYESIVGGIGTVYLAATHVIFSIFRINKTIAGGFSRGAAILVGNALGSGDKVRASEVMHSALIISSVIGAVILSAVFISPGGVVSLFTEDPSVVDAGVRALNFFAFFFFIEVLGYTLEIVFGGTGWGRYVLFSEAVSNVVFIIGASLLLMSLFPRWGVYGAWTGFALYQLSHAAILFAGYFSGRWLRVEVDKR